MPNQQTDTTTNMTDDIQVQATEIAEPLEILQMLKNVTMTNTPIVSIESFLAKPYPFATGVLSASDTATTFPVYHYPSFFMNLDIYAQKIKGHFYFRGTIVVTLQVNASPVHCGLYYLAALPTGGSSSANSDFTNWFTAHYYSVIQRSQLPHASIDLATQTSCTLKVPYVSAYTATTISTATTDNAMNGALTWFPISPVAVGAGGDATVGYTAWCHWEDVELNTPVAPHSGKAFEGFQKNLAKKSDQMGTQLPTELEQKSKKIGPITSFLSKTATAAALASMVPALTAVAAPAAFFLTIASGVAAVFGWSKPRNADVQTMITRDYLYGTQVVDASDNSRIMALSDMNTIEVLPGFAGTDVDELAFDAFLTRPTIVQSTTWSSGQATGTSLMLFPIGAGSFFTPATFHTITHYSFAPVSMLAQYFQYWRGDFRLTLQLVKTALHSGRLMFVYSPYQTSGLTDHDASVTESTYCWRHIVDVRTTNIVSLVFPFTSNSQYRPTDILATDAFMGSLQIYVLDELVAPTTCTQTIDIIMQVAAEPGFEFAVPRNNVMSPVIGPTIIASPHSGTMFEGTIVSSPIGDSVPQPDTQCESARKCIGERITSLRQLAKRNSPFAHLTGVPIDTNTNIAIYPYSTEWSFINTGINVLSPTAYYGDFLSVLQSIFALSRGSIRLKVLNYAGGFGLSLDATPVTSWLSSIARTTTTIGFAGKYAGTDPSGASLNQYLTNSIVCFNNFAERGGLEAQIPHYSRYHSRSNSQLQDSAFTATDLTGTSPRIAFVYTPTSDNILTVMRSGGDDYNCGCFVSIPPMVFPSAAL